VICSASEGEFVTETDEITDSTSTETFMQLTICTRINTSYFRRNVLKLLTDGDGIDLSFYNDRGILAAEQVNYVAEFRIFHSQRRFVLLILLQSKFSIAQLQSIGKD
jgi:hypothetical protein